MRVNQRYDLFVTFLVLISCTLCISTILLYLVSSTSLLFSLSIVNLLFAIVSFIVAEYFSHRCSVFASCIVALSSFLVGVVLFSEYGKGTIYIREGIIKENIESLITEADNEKLYNFAKKYGGKDSEFVYNKLKGLQLRTINLKEDKYNYEREIQQLVKYIVNRQNSQRGQNGNKPRNRSIQGDYS